MVCHKCGNHISDNAKFCENCGAQLLGIDDAPPTIAKKIEPMEWSPPKRKSGILRKIICASIVCALLISLALFFGLFELPKFDNRENTDASAPETSPSNSISGETFIIGNFTFYVPESFSVTSSEGGAPFILSSADNDCIIILYASDISNMDESTANSFLYLQHESLTEYEFVVLESDDIYAIIDEFPVVLNSCLVLEDGKSNLCIDGTFTDSFYGYTLVYKVNMDSDSQSDYNIQFVDLMACSQYNGKDPRFPLVQSDLSVNGFDETEEINSDTEISMTTSQKNALRQAKSYLDLIPFSYSGLIDQLVYEGYPVEDATFAVDNCGADWFEQAALKAADYLDLKGFSRQGLIDQLMHDGFTAEQAEHAVQENGY